MDMVDMGHGHMHGMGGMAPPSMNPANMPHHHSHDMMHMTFFWGKNAEILFSNWPGHSTGMYVLALIVVFILAFLAEFVSNCKLIKTDSNKNVAVGLVQTFLHLIRIVLVYLVMLAVMSFNVGVFLVAVAGHTVGFLLFGSSVFKKSTSTEKTSALPPTSCNC